MSKSYTKLAERHRRHFHDEVARLSRHLHWDRTTLASFQLTQLKSVLSHAVKHSRFYRQHLTNLDIDNMQSLADLQQIPPITKSDVMRHWDEMVCTPQLTIAEARQHVAQLREDCYFKQEFHILSTSASSGNPGLFAYGWEEWPTYLAGSQRWINATLEKQDLKMENLVSVQIGPHLANHMTAAMHDTFSSGNPLRQRISVFEQPHAMIQQLNAIAPDLLLCYPSVMSLLLHEQHHSDLQISPKIIIANSEPLSPALRQRLKEHWPAATVLNLMGSTEGGVMAISCEKQHGLHVNEDLVVIEPVLQDGSPAQPGCLSDKFYLTNLFNCTLPIIRYEMQDNLNFSATACACGSAYQWIAEPQGREADIFRYANGMTILCRIVIGGVLDRAKSLSGFHVWQTPDGIELGLLAQEAGDTTLIEQEIYRCLEEAGLKNPVITIKLLTEFMRGKTGKMQRYIPCHF